MSTKVPVNRHNAILEDKHGKIKKKLLSIPLIKLDTNISSKEIIYSYNKTAAIPQSHDRDIPLTPTGGHITNPKDCIHYIPLKLSKQQQKKYKESRIKLPGLKHLALKM